MRKLSVLGAALLAAMKAQPELTPLYNEWVVWLADTDDTKKSPAKPV